LAGDYKLKINVFLFKHPQKTEMEWKIRCWSQACWMFSLYLFSRINNVKVISLV